MIRALSAALLCAASALASAALTSMPARNSATPAAVAHSQFRAPSIAASVTVTLPVLEPAQKSIAATPAKPNEPLRVGAVRAVPKSSSLESWTPVDGGFVARMNVASTDALGLRVKLDLTGVVTPIEVRVQGNDGRVEWMAFDPKVRGNEAWTPWTEGSEQTIEVFSAAALDPGAVRIGAVVHFTDSPFAKAAASCTISTACTTGDGALDAAMAERKKSVARINFIDGGSSFACTGTLINTERFPDPFFMTANHCINNQPAASSITAIWFYEDSGCATNTPSGTSEQIASGAELVMGNFNLDSTLLKLNAPPPSRAVYAGWDRSPVAVGTSIFNISHPRQDTSRWALGSMVDDDGRIEGPVQQFNIVEFTRGFIEPGSSGSGLFALAGGSFQFRGTLLGSYVTDPPYSCTNSGGGIIYSRFDIFEPQIDQYIRTASQAADDAPNRARDLFNAFITDPLGVDQPLNERSSTLALDNRRIDYVGDIDVYRFRLTAPAWVSTWTEGSQDTIGSILDSRGVNVESNDDWQIGPPYNFGITKFLLPGTYYAEVGHFEATGTGAYDLRMRADMVDTNYTALWWNPAENGWGLNLNHQGNTIFGTLYTYDASGNPAWFSMSDGVKQPDGSYQGHLVSSGGPAFNTSPWNPNAVTRNVVGSMKIDFTNDENGTLTYNVGAAQVTKAISRLTFKTPPTCTWSASDRSQETNFQDLWWGGPSESGWGVNLTHQGDIIFATLFTYDASGQPRWFVMSDGSRSGVATYSGALYRTTGPAFNSAPFTPITAANNVQVGNMTFAFTSGNAGTMTYTVNGVSVTKAIQRLAFDAIKPKCTQPT